MQVAGNKHVKLVIKKILNIYIKLNNFIKSNKFLSEFMEGNLNSLFLITVEYFANQVTFKLVDCIRYWKL